MNGLKPCPFCGGTAYVSDLSEEDDRRYYERIASCSSCNCSLSETIGWNEYRRSSHAEAARKVKSNLITNWNTRTKN